MRLAELANRLRARLEFLEHIVKDGDKWKLLSQDRKKVLGTFDSREEAVKRERQIEYFKHEGK